MISGGVGLCPFFFKLPAQALDLAQVPGALGWRVEPCTLAPDVATVPTRPRAVVDDGRLAPLYVFDGQWIFTSFACRRD